MTPKEQVALRLVTLMLAEELVDEASCIIVPSSRATEAKRALLVEAQRMMSSVSDRSIN